MTTEAQQQGVANGASTASVYGKVDPLFMALLRLRRRRYDETVAIADSLLEKRPRDQAAWFVKCRSLVERGSIDDTEMEDEGVAETILDDNAIASLPRPGTSLRSSANSSDAPSSATPSSAAATRPVTNSGRPVTGFSRPGTQSTRPTTAQRALEQALGGGRLATGSRPDTASMRPVTCAGRPLTASARFIRLGTASLVPTGPTSEFIQVDRLDLKRYATRPALAKALFMWLLVHDNNPTKALELATEASRAADFRDWWWKAQIGKCYYRLGLLRDAERFLASSLKEQPMVETFLWLGKVFLRVDQPRKALETYQTASEKFPGEVSLLLGSARVYDALGDAAKSVPLFKKVLGFDSSNVEAIACIAANHFYGDQPELALRYYRRLLQMGVDNAEIWNNLGLSCFYAQQYDMTLHCFTRALQLADDTNMADVWYNIGQVAIGLGDTGLAFQSFKIATSIDPSHAEAFNNLGILELRKGNVEQARSAFASAQQLGPHLHDPFYNAALLMYKLGDFQESYKLIVQALRIFPEHEDSKELKGLLDGLFSGM